MLTVVRRTGPGRMRLASLKVTPGRAQRLVDVTATTAATKRILHAVGDSGHEAEESSHIWDRFTNEAKPTLQSVANFGLRKALRAWAHCRNLRIPKAAAPH
jgi:hypothetical protein